MNVSRLDVDVDGIEIGLDETCYEMWRDWVASDIRNFVNTKMNAQFLQNEEVNSWTKSQLFKEDPTR
jgi:hypothetical protein